jgi:hypothetical protein
MTNLQLIDAFGTIKARIADLEAEAKAMHAQLLALGEGAYEGDLFRVTVEHSTRTNVDRKAILDVLQPSRQLVTAHTSYSDVWTVKAKARNGRALAA